MARVLGTAQLSLLVVFGGLPGAGKTSVARRVADALDATFVRVDSIEVAIERVGVTLGDAPAGYAVGHAVAADQLAAGRPVVVDAVNSVRIARAGWEQLAATCAARLEFVHVVVSDVAEHRHRVESRVADLAGHQLPTWADVCAIEQDVWTEPRLDLDNSGSLDGAVAQVLGWLSDDR